MITRAMGIPPPLTMKGHYFMSKFRETPCKYYLACGECQKGREASYKGYCQHCDQYYPRAKVHHINKKKQYNEIQRGKYAD